MTRETFFNATFLCNRRKYIDTMRLTRKIITLTITFAFAILCTCDANAGVSDLFSSAMEWWGERSFSKKVERSKAFDEPVYNDDVVAEEEEGEEEEDNYSGGLSGMCKVPQQPAIMICEIGSGFICVNTPPGGVDEDIVRIKGTIDRNGSVLASIRIAVQNEYTKKTEYVDTSDPSTSGCWGKEPSERPFCLDSEGRYSASVPLSQKGPYTISVSASRLSGESVEKRVRTSRVVAPNFDDGKLTFEPDVRKVDTVDGSMVTATIELLGDCNFCDFIGASTGGITATVENRIGKNADGEKGIKCITTVEQGGQGRFVIGVPVMPGANEFIVRICNAAVEGACPEVGGIKFKATGSVAKLNTISPPPQPNYDSDEYPTIYWQFTMDGGASCINMMFNREALVEVCSNGSGVFSAELKPRVGINVASLASGDGPEEFAWTFGWGKIKSPFSERSSSMEISDAGGLFMSKRMVEDILVPFLNNFLASDEFDSFITQMLAESLTQVPEAEENVSETDISEDDPLDFVIPKCDAGGGLGASKMTMSGMPIIEGIRLKDFSISDGRLSLSVVLDGVKVEINFAPDKNNDGVGDKDPLPLILAFKKAIVDLAIESSKDEAGNPFIFITSPHDDCDYKDSDYCKHLPAPLIPKNFVGDATSWGAFIRCDVKKAKGEAKDACKAINSLNAQTALVSELVLDSINSLIYCNGSKMATGIAQGYASFPLSIGCTDEEPCEGAMAKLLPPMTLPLGVSLEDGIDISSAGIMMDVGVSVGDRKFFDKIPATYHIPSSGIVVGDDENSGFATALASGFDLGASISLDAVNMLLYAASAHGDGYDVRGVLDFDIHEPFFNDLGFDFVKECDEFQPIPGLVDKPPTLCLIRPRVVELLGSFLTTYGYFDAKHPMMMALRGNRALGPRIAVTTIEELPVVQRSSGKDSPLGDSAVFDPPTGSVMEIALGGIMLSFYALEIDDTQPLDMYGNYPIKMDAEGRPAILSMRPDDGNPWNGQIVSFDVVLLLGLEVMDLEPDLEEESGSILRIRTLADRSRFIVTPIDGSNTTTIPSRRLIASLAEQIMAAIAQFSPKESAISIPISDDFEFEPTNEDSIFTSVGLRRISFGPGGLSLGLDHEQNMINLAISAIIEQVLHIDGERVEYVYPQ